MIAVLLVLLQAAPATVPANPTVVVTAPKPEKRVCHYSEDTGSRMSRTRTCHTPSEWRALQVGADPRAVNELMNTNGYNSGSITVKEPGGGVARPVM